MCKNFTHWTFKFLFFPIPVTKWISEKSQVAAVTMKQNTYCAFFGLWLTSLKMFCPTFIQLSSFYDASFTQWGHLLGPVTGVPVEFDLDRAPGVWVEWLLKQLLHLVWNLKIYTAFEKKKRTKKTEHRQSKLSCVDVFMYRSLNVLHSTDISDVKIKCRRSTLCIYSACCILKRNRLH